MDRIYKIIELPNENVVHALNVSIGANETQRYSLDGSKIIIKTTQSLIDKEISKGSSLNKIFPNVLTTDCTHEEILLEVQKPEWQNNDI
jgi:hypothetical protein